MLNLYWCQEKHHKKQQNISACIQLNSENTHHFFFNSKCKFGNDLFIWLLFYNKSIFKRNSYRNLTSECSLPRILWCFTCRTTAISLLLAYKQIDVESDNSIQVIRKCELSTLIIANLMKLYEHHRRFHRLKVWSLNKKSATFPKFCIFVLFLHSINFPLHWQ